MTPKSKKRQEKIAEKKKKKKENKKLNPLFEMNILCCWEQIKSFEVSAPFNFSIYFGTEMGTGWWKKLQSPLSASCVRTCFNMRLNRHVGAVDFHRAVVKTKLNVAAPINCTKGRDGVALAYCFILWSWRSVSDCYFLLKVWEQDVVIGQAFDRGGKDGITGWIGPQVRFFGFLVLTASPNLIFLPSCN